jgi:hypothetical protein
LPRPKISVPRSASHTRSPRKSPDFHIKQSSVPIVIVSYTARACRHRRLIEIVSKPSAIVLSRKKSGRESLYVPFKIQSNIPFLSAPFSFSTLSAIQSLAVKADLQLGLHSAKASKRFSPLDQEIRKRTWYGCVILDRTLSMTFYWKLLDLLAPSPPRLD